jgi:hypothetical protein
MTQGRIKKSQSRFSLSQNISKKHSLSLNGSNWAQLMLKKARNISVRLSNAQYVSKSWRETKRLDGTLPFLSRSSENGIDIRGSIFGSWEQKTNHETEQRTKKRFNESAADRFSNQRLIFRLMGSIYGSWVHGFKII